LKGRQAAMSACSKACMDDASCIAFSGIPNLWCVGCKQPLESSATSAAGARAFTKAGSHGPVAQEKGKLAREVEVVSQASSQMKRSPGQDGKKCGSSGSNDRTFILTGRDATVAACTAACDTDASCKFFSGLPDLWCVGCKKPLTVAEAGGAHAFTKNEASKEEEVDGNGQHGLLDGIDEETHKESVEESVPPSTQDDQEDSPSVDSAQVVRLESDDRAKEKGKGKDTIMEEEKKDSEESVQGKMERQAATQSRRMEAEAKAVERRETKEEGEKQEHNHEHGRRRHRDQAPGSCHEKKWCPSEADQCRSKTDHEVRHKCPCTCAKLL